MARHYRRLIYWLLAVVATLLLLALGALAALWWFVDPDDYRHQIETRASDAIGRPVRLTGVLRWQLGSRIFLSSDGGEIANAAGFGHEPLLRWSKLRLGVALRPLLRKQVLVDRVDLDGLQLRLERNAAGVGNWQFQLAESADDKASPFTLRIAEVNLSNGDARYQDAASGADWQLHELAFHAQLPEDLAAADRHFGEVSLAGRAAGGPLAEGGVRFSLRAQSVRVSEQLQIPQFAGQWADADFSGGVVAQLGAAPIATATLKLRAPSLRDLLATVRVTPPPMKDPDTLGKIEVITALRYAADAATLSELSVALDETTLTGTLSLPRLAPLSLRFDLAADRINLDRYLAPDDAPGKPFELPLAELKALDAKGALRIQQATVAGAAAREIRIDVE